MQLRPAMVTITVAVLASGCGGKPKQLADNTTGLGALVNSANAVTESAKEAEKFMADRRAKGDTIAMNYKDLEGFLPSAPSGYTADGGAKGESMNMGVFSMTTAEQRFMAGTDPDVARIHVTIADYSGSTAGYGVMTPFMAMNMSSEDDHHRAGSVPIGLPTTFGMAEYNKDNKDARITVGTRYRYMITVEASGQKGDESKLVADIATDIARKLANK